MQAITGTSDIRELDRSAIDWAMFDTVVFQSTFFRLSTRRELSDSYLSSLNIILFY